MTRQQKAAIKKLESALNACHDAGMKGGIFDGKFCVWPIDTVPDPYECGNQFFDVISEFGDIIGCQRTPMNLDGGAGV